jgi:hypothetical protein
VAQDPVVIEDRGLAAARTYLETRERLGDRRAIAGRLGSGDRQLGPPSDMYEMFTNTGEGVKILT